MRWIIAALLLAIGLTACGTRAVANESNSVTEQAASGTCHIIPGHAYDVNYSQTSVVEYDVSLTNTSSANDDVSDIQVAFFSRNTQIGSDEQNITGDIVSGQMLSWTLDMPSDLVSTIVVRPQSVKPDGTFIDELDEQVTTATSCRVIGWA